MDKCKYTFLLPAYKSHYLAEALESIKQQSYSNFCCLVSDDCSPMNIKGVYDEVVGNDSRFSYRRNKENIGGKSLVAHWNLLVDMADTEFLIMASDDDIYETNFLEEINKLTIKYPNVDLFRGRVSKIDDKGEEYWNDPLIDEYTQQLEFLYHFFNGYCSKCIAQYVFRTEKLKKINAFYDLPLAWCSDDATVIKMSESGVCHTPNIVFTFRLSGQNITSNGSLDIIKKKTKALYLFSDFMINYIENIPTNEMTKYQKSLYGGVTSLFQKSYYIESLIQGAELRNYKEMLPYFHMLEKMQRFSGTLDKVHFFWNWIRAYKSRRLCQ